MGEVSGHLRSLSVFSSWITHLRLHTTGQLCRRLPAGHLSVFSLSQHQCRWHSGRVLASLKVTGDLARGLWPRNQKTGSLVAWAGLELLLFRLSVMGFQACTTSVCGAGI